MRPKFILVLALLISVGSIPASSGDPPTLIQITHGGSQYAPSTPFGISDDGRRIAWVQSPELYGTTWRVFVANEDGTATRQVTSIECFSFAAQSCGGISMSGDGRKIAYGSCANPLGTNPGRTCQIFLIDTEGTNLRQLTNQTSDQAFNPKLNRDGSVVAYEQYGFGTSVVVTRRLSDDHPVIVDVPPHDRDWRFDPALDSAGDRIVLQGTSSVLDTCGARAARTDGSESHELAPFTVPLSLVPGIHISRDGSTTLLSSAGDYTGENPGGGNIFDPIVQAFIVPWQGGTIRQVTDATQVHWAVGADQPMVADGSRAALGLTFHGFEECAVVWVDTRTGETEDIFPRSAATCADGPPEVSSDGRVLAFSSTRVTGENPDGFRQVFVLRYGPPPGGSAPHAAAGPDQLLECQASLTATALLDGSASTDPDSTPGSNDDIASYAWSEGATSLATAVTASVPLHLGAHNITLTVTDKAGATGSDDTKITVQDTMPPSGSILTPAPDACFGPGALPVAVTDNFSDACDPTVLRTYDPAPGPNYSGHGDHHVTLLARDRSSNAVTASVDFTIDTKPPVVDLISPADHALLAPSSLPFSILFRDSDDDGAAGGVLHEVIKLQGCPIFDGLTYGNRDGLLSDESISFGVGDLCRAAAVCGFTVLTQPELRVEATDCGGNVGIAAHHFTGSIALRPGICGN